MIRHESLDAILIRFDHPAHLRADLLVPGAADLAVPHDSLPQVFPEKVRAENLGHRAGCSPVVLQKLFQPVLGLGVANGVRCIVQGASEDMRDAKLVPIDRRRLCGTGRGPRRRRKSQQHGGNNRELHSPHGVKSFQMVGRPKRDQSVVRRGRFPPATILSFTRGSDAIDAGTPRADFNGLCKGRHPLFGGRLDRMARTWSVPDITPWVVPISIHWRESPWSAAESGRSSIPTTLPQRGIYLAQVTAMNEESLFQKWLAKSPEERAAFLGAACVGQPELRTALEALLAAHEQAGGVIDKPPAKPRQTVDPTKGEARGSGTGDFSRAPDEPDVQQAMTTDHQPTTGPGGVIAGRYTLIREIGQGGMGEVWAAKQTEPVKRKVALKLIKAGMDSRAVLQRFDQERQALA